VGWCRTREPPFRTAAEKGGRVRDCHGEGSEDGLRSDHQTRSLNQAQVYAALAYYHENPQGIEDALGADREAAERIDSDRAEFLRKHSAQ